MSNEKIIVDIIVEVDEATKSAAAVVSELKKVDKAAEDVGKSGKVAGESIGTGFKNAVKEANLLDKAVDGIADQIRKVTGIDVKPITNAFKNYRKELTAASQATKAQAQSVELLTKANTFSVKAWGLATTATRVFKVALASTGIGAIVIALGALAAALFTTQRGADALTKVITPLKVIFQATLGVMQDLGFAIVKAFEDPQQAVKDLFVLVRDNIINRFKAIPALFSAIGKSITSGLKGDVDGIKDSLIDAGQAVVQFTTGLDKAAQAKVGNFVGEQLKTAEKLVAIDKQLKLLAIERAEVEGRLNRQYEEQVAISDDVNKSNKERVAAGEKAIQIQNELKKLELAEIDLLIEQLRLNNELNDTSDAGKAEYAALVASKEDLEARFLLRTKEVRNKINGINKIAAAEGVRIATEAQAKIDQLEADRLARAERLQEQITALQVKQSVDLLDEYDKRRAAANDYYDALIVAAEGNAERIKDIQDLLYAELATITAEQTQKVLDDAIRLQDGLDALGLSAIDREKLAIEEKYAELLKLAEGNASATMKIEEQIAKEKLQLEKEVQAQIRAERQQTAATSLAAIGTIFGAFSDYAKKTGKESKELAAFTILVNTASAIAGAVSAGSTLPFPANLAAIASGIAAVLSGIAQAKSVFGQANGYAEGTAYLQRGSNPSGVDTIPVMANEGEAIIPTKRNKQYPGLSKAIINGDIDGWISRYNFKGRLEYSNPINTTYKSNFNDVNMVLGLRNVVRSQSETNELLSKLARSNKFKRAG